MRRFLHSRGRVHLSSTCWAARSTQQAAVIARHRAWRQMVASGVILHELRQHPASFDALRLLRLGNGGLHKEPPHPEQASVARARRRTLIRSTRFNGGIREGPCHEARARPRRFRLKIPFEGRPPSAWLGGRIGAARDSAGARRDRGRPRRVALLQLQCHAPCAPPSRHGGRRSRSAAMPAISPGSSCTVSRLPLHLFGLFGATASPSSALRPPPPRQPSLSWTSPRSGRKAAGGAAWSARRGWRSTPMPASSGCTTPRSCHAARERLAEAIAASQRNRRRTGSERLRARPLVPAADHGDTNCPGRRRSSRDHALPSKPYDLPLGSRSRIFPPENFRALSALARRPGFP